VEAERPFTSYQDFLRRTGLRGAVVKKLAQADAFLSLGLSRRAALWQSLPQGEPLPLFDKMEAVSGQWSVVSEETSPLAHPTPLDEEPLPTTLPAMAPLQEVLADYSSAGLSLRQHPMAFIRGELDKLGVEQASKLAVLPTDGSVKVAGVVLLRQRPSTAKGITFVTLEDETGMANLIIRQNVWERHRRVARQANVMLAHGRLQREAGVIHVLVSKLEDLSPTLARLNTASRDFR
jgi:error-prone DNA polymerase